MKRLSIIIAMALVVAVPVLFTSCDDEPWDRFWYYDEYGDAGPWWFDYGNGGWNWDNNYWNSGGDYNGGGSQGNSVLDEAEVLEGEWDGVMAYTNGDDGTVSRFYANMTFVRNDSRAIKGTGTEVDYTLDSSNQVDSQQTLKFNWYIDEKTGDIHIHYLTSNGSAFVMDASAGYHGFSLVENERFEGYMIGTNNNDMIYVKLNPVQNNEAKKLTRASFTRSFGADNIAPIKGGREKLDNRR